MVKYADGPTAEATAEIAAAPGQVWPLLCDINVPAQFSTEFVRAEWIDDGPAIGARFRGHNRREDMEWDVECTVTAMEPSSVFEWTVGDVDDKVARWRFDLEPAGDGSRLRFSAEMGPGRSGLSPIIESAPDQEEAIVGHRLGEWSRNMAATVEGIKALAEQPTE